MCTWVAAHTHIEVSLFKVLHHLTVMEFPAEWSLQEWKGGWRWVGVQCKADRLQVETGLRTGVKKDIFSVFFMCWSVGRKTVAPV